MVALLAKSVDRSGRSALSKKPGQDTGVEMTNRLLYPFVSTDGLVYTGRNNYGSEPARDGGLSFNGDVDW
jgi:hypothetical protein